MRITIITSIIILLLFIIGVGVATELTIKLFGFSMGLYADMAIRATVQVIAFIIPVLILKKKTERSFEQINKGLSIAISATSETDLKNTEDLLLPLPDFDLLNNNLNQLYVLQRAILSNIESSINGNISATKFMEIAISGSQTDVRDDVVAITSMEKVVDRMTQQINLLKDVIDKDMSVVAQVTTRAEQQIEHLQGMVESIDMLMDIITDLVTNVENLDGDMSTIASIISTIQGLSSQTDLLALNAAIESARAGKHGRGFAVVADEVRKLSMQTRHALDDIGEKITEVENHATRAMNKTSETRQTMDMISTTAHGTSDDLSKIKDDLLIANKSIASVSSASDEQAVLVAEVSTVISHLKGRIKNAESIQYTLGQALSNVSNSLTHASAVVQGGDIVEESSSFSSDDDFFGGDAELF